VNAWYLSKTLADLPFDLATTFILATSIYWVVGFTSSASNYGYFLGILCLIALLSTGLGHLVGTVAFAIGKPEFSLPLVLLVMFPMFIFAGLLVNFNDCPDYLLWLQYTSIFYYGFSLVSNNQWTDYGSIHCSKSDAAATGTGRCAFMSGEDVLAYFGIEEDQKTRDLMVVIAVIIFCRVACSILMQRKLAVKYLVAPAKISPLRSKGGAQQLPTSSL